jgi:hypothetical protein
MTPILRLLPILLLLGCAALQPGADPIVVRAEQTTAIALDTFDLFLRVERQNEASLYKLNPKIHDFANLIRREAPQWLETARHLTKTYKSSRTEASKANLGTIVSLLLTSISEAQRYVAMAAPETVPSP